jgi:peptidoglycan/LPS O-acetylase OafA/YrhL
MSTTYRSDIDGLRAIAILSVVAFHAFPASFPGGLVGVDIFFVISGFLITGLISSELSENRFSFGNFYSRRIKRILPILSTVLFCTFIFGWFVLYFDDYEVLGKHIAAAASFTSNFVYLGESSYFDLDADAKPLLHLWSLAIEEQFYLLWPIILFLCSKKYSMSGVKMIIIMLVLSAVSFGYCVYLTNTKPDAAYYLPFTRFWELSFGGLIVLISRKYKINQGISQYATVAGLVLLLCSFILINKDSGFPGYIALLPCLGAAAILLSNEDSIGNKLILRNRVFIFFGLTSYSFYLWHWPVLFFVRNLIPDPGTSALLLSLLFSLVLAAVGYYLIESPIRRMKSRYAAFLLIFVLGLVGYLGLNAFQRNGLDFREINGRVVLTKLFQNRASLDPDFKAPASSLSFTVNDSEKPQLDKLVYKLRNDPETIKKIKSDSEIANNADLFCSGAVDKGGACLGGGETSNHGTDMVVQIVGDSHASNFFQAMKIAYPRTKLVSFIEGGCVPISKRYPKKDSLCRKTILGAMSYVETHKVDLVILSSRWPGSFEEVQPDLDHYKKYVKKVALVGPSLTFYKDVYKIISDFTASTPFNDYVLENFDSSNISRNYSMNKFSLANGVSYIDKISLYCPNNVCPLFKEEKLFIFDKGHLTGSGVSHLASGIRMEDPISRILDSPTPVSIESHLHRQPTLTPTPP